MILVYMNMIEFISFNYSYIGLSIEAYIFRVVKLELGN